MACTYIYKGRKFNSEIELDDFLLEKAPFEPTLKDLVFSMTTAQLNVALLLNEISENAAEDRQRMEDAFNAGRVTYDEDGDMSISDPPYIGVNKFLSTLTKANGEILFPQFREEEYWSRRYLDWRRGNFKDAEIEEFGLDKDHLPRITDIEQCKNLRKLMTHKWEILAKTGTAIHNILLLCFTKSGDKYNFELDDAALKDVIQNNIERKNKPFITEEAIDQTIEYARRLHTDLILKFGEGCEFYPEFTVTQETNVIENGHPIKLMGIIDLLIVDSTGKTHILDYKTSIHDYLHFGAAKKYAYSYLLATYLRMLEKYGLNTYESLRLISPIQITNFRKEGNRYIYDGISAPETFVSIDNTLNSSLMWDNIDEFMSAPFNISFTTERANETVSDMMGKWFPSYLADFLVTRENLIRRLRRNNMLTPNENGLYVYRKYNREAPITARSEAEFVDKILRYEQSLPARRLELTGKVKNALKEAIRDGFDNVEFPSPYITESLGSVTWLQDLLKPYCNDNWEVVDNQTLESYGVITMKSRHAPNQIDYIRVTTNNLTDDYRKNSANNENVFQNRTSLVSTYEDDVILQSKSDNLMALATLGNVELMETMLLINQIRGLEGYTIGNILVLNPLYAKGIKLSNEELLYCWKQLNSHDAVSLDNFENGNIKLATKYELARNTFDFIMSLGETSGWTEDLRKFARLLPCRLLLDENINSTSELKINALKELLTNLQKISNKVGKVYYTEAELLSKEVSLYNQILEAIANLKGINYRLQLNDHDMFIENLAIWKHGVSGTYMDNPGNMNSETLNSVTTLVTEAYQNVRDELQKEKITIKRLVDNLRKEKSLNPYLNNLVNLYSNMFRDYHEGGDFLFKNPNQLMGAEKEFLDYVLTKINKNRFPTLSDEVRENMKNSDDPAYYRVPLARGSDDSLASTGGLLSVLRAKLRNFSPKEALRRAREKVEGLFNADDSIELQLKSLLLYQMTNMFDLGEDVEKRMNKLTELGIENIEHNLETLLYKHIFAYSTKSNMDGVFPMIKAAMTHLATQGAILNRKFQNDTHYLENYIRNKIFNLSIVDPKLLKFSHYSGLLKRVASGFTLAFSPVLALYQPLQGLWNDISLMIRKPDGKQSFTFNNFSKALKLVYSDLAHYSDKPTLCSALNELYGINDMDMNVYVDRISSAKKGIFNMENFMFKFASRPDFYNRLTIFTSLMMADGCLDAHKINSNGELEYDWKKDKRFEAFANNRTSDPKYNLLKALYYTIAKQFVAEHAKTKNGKDFKLDMSDPMALPRAYTNKEAESMKSLGDDIYGYYSHEKKSLIMSTALGSLWLQFKTYWSGKKNLYLQSGGVRLRGKWEQYEENGLKYYYQMDLSGNILFDQPPTTNETAAPVMQWKGQWLEGIILTLSNLSKNVLSKGFKDGWDSLWNNENTTLRNAYRNNIKQAGYDLMMFLLGGCILSALLGDWLDSMKDPKNKDLTEGLKMAAAKVGVMSLRNSFLDFNTWDSIGGAVSSWTPFSFDWGYNLWKNIWNVATGDTDFWDGVVNSTSVTKQIKPVFDAIKPDNFRTPREGGTFGTE